MDWPFPPMLTNGLVHITPVTGCSVGGQNTGTLGAPASTVNPGANTARLFPFRLSTPFIATQMFIHNGATVAGNVDVGIYDRAGTRLVSKGSTAQAGTNAIQTFDITDTYLYPGLYYMAFCSDSGTATFFANGPSNVLWKVLGAAQMATAFALPATVTFATYTPVFGPVFGLSGRSFI